MKCPGMIKEAIYKEASPKWIKMIRSGKLSKESLKRLAGAGYKDRTLKSLGSGASRVVDLVFTKRHGIAVRKIPKIEGTSKGMLQKIYSSQAKEHQLWKEIQKFMTKKNIPVAKILGQKGPVGYYEYVSGKNVTGKLKNVFGKIDKFLASANKSNISKRRMTIRRAGKAIDKITNITERSFISKPKLQLLKKKYPYLRDTATRNVVGGKLVDFDIGKHVAGEIGRSPFNRETYKAFAKGMDSNVYQKTEKVRKLLKI